MGRAVVVWGLLMVLACGGTPIKLEVGDTKLEIGPTEEIAAEEPVDEGANQAATAGSKAPGKAQAAPAPAARKGPGQIQVSTGRGIAPTVDGAPMRSTSEGYFAEAAAGRRVLVIHNLLGKQKGKQTVQVKSGRRHVFTWDGSTIAPGGERAVSPLPAAMTLNSDVVITGLLIQDASTTVTIAGRAASRDQTGVFRRDDVAPGRQQVLIHAGGFDLYNGTVEVGYGGETRCGFVLGSGAWVPNCTHTL